MFDIPGLHRMLNEMVRDLVVCLISVDWLKLDPLGLQSATCSIFSGLYCKSFFEAVHQN